MEVICSYPVYNLFIFLSLCNLYFQKNQIFSKKIINLINISISEIIIIYTLICSYYVFFFNKIFSLFHAYIKSGTLIPQKIYKTLNRTQNL